MIKFPKYFETYGGLNELVKSKYFCCAVILAIATEPFFRAPKWWDLSISVIPGLVGFSIAGIAIFVSLGSDSLREVITGKVPGSATESPFIKFMAMFTHFIVAQLLALLFAFLAKAFYESTGSAPAVLASVVADLRLPFWFIGGLLFLYALLLCVALALEIYRLAIMIDDFQTAENESREAKNSE